MLYPQTAARIDFNGLYAGEGSFCLPSPVDIVRELAAICQELRETHKLGHVHVSAQIRFGSGQDPRTLRAFEQGKTQPNHLGEILNGYCSASGVSLVEMLDRLREKAQAELELPEAGDDPTPETHRLGSEETDPDTATNEEAEEGGAR